VLAAGHNVSPIPGACAPIAALVASGLPTDTFFYLGYLPRRQVERRRLLQSIAGLPHTLIFLETPHRLLEALADLIAQLGDRSIAVGRELTKLHEEIFRGTLSQAEAHFTSQPPRGEFTLVIAGGSATPERWNEERLSAALREAQGSHEKPAALARRLAAESGWSKSEVYELLKNLRGNQ
jgi:16S rRNA (cytidine1402-2'-O)-methyltransferase